MAKITWSDKFAAEDPSNPQPNEELTSGDINEVKHSVNDLYDVVDTNATAASTAIGTEVTNRNNAIAAEATARDTAIGTAIGTEVTNRNNAIAAEATARDTAIGTAIGTEVTNRNNAISTAVYAEAGARNTAIGNAVAAEVSDRTAADAALLSKINTLTAALVPHPVYTPPSATLSSTQTTAGLEVGQVINIPLTIGFNQNDGGAKGVTSLKKDGVEIATASPFTDNGVIMAITAKVYQASVGYAQGGVKNNAIGLPDATGQIGAGTALSALLSYQGFYRVWYDTVAAFPTDSATARALTNTRFSNSGNIFTLNTGTVNTKFCIVLPPGKSLVSVIDQDALNLDITAQFVQSAITVNDAAGTAVPTYKIYAMSQSIAYSSSHRFNITIA